jgi:hypothetical protein
MTKKIKFPNPKYKTFLMEIKEIEEPEYTVVTTVVDNGGLFGVWQTIESGTHKLIWRLL